MARARTICPRVGCGSTQPCVLHPRIPWAGHGSRHERGYGSEWDSRRKRILERDEHTCRYCGEHATTVDHRKPKAEGGTDDDYNLVACCWKCQQSKAGREGAAARMRKETHR